MLCWALKFSPKIGVCLSLSGTCTYGRGISGRREGRQLPAQVAREMVRPGGHAQAFQALFGFWSYCPFIPLVALLAAPPGKWKSEVLVPKSCSPTPLTPGRLSREALRTSLGSWHGVDLSLSPCLKATSSQSEARLPAEGAAGRPGAEGRGERGPSASACGTGCPAVS